MKSGGTELEPVGRRLWLKSKFTGAPAVISLLVANLAQAGASTARYWIRPGGAVLVTAVPKLTGSGKGRRSLKRNDNCQLRSMGEGSTAPARVSRISSFQSPRADWPTNLSSDASGR